MAREGKASVTLDEETRDTLRTFKGTRSWDEFLIERAVESSPHVPETEERSGPTGEYVICKECGRTENTLAQLDQRPCKDGISVKENLS